jgi:UDP-N-acetylmuramate dehydrogenase
MTATQPIAFQTHAPIPTWFGIGGHADRLARPNSVAELRACLEIDPTLRVLGDGANLLVSDEGVDDLVVTLGTEFEAVRPDPRSNLAVVGAAASLFKIIPEFVRQGLSGLETLAGIPARVGGAIVMNAGGKFGQIADAVVRVHALDRQGRAITLERNEIGFAYRTSGLHNLIITSAEVRLTPEDPALVRARFKDIMAYKKSTQPMAEKSAGCVFKNPLLAHDLEGLAPAGQRASAGMLIDRAGLKGLAVGGASVSHAHANFIITRDGARANDVIALMAELSRRVHDRFGVALEPEVVIWRRSS